MMIEKINRQLHKTPVQIALLIFLCGAIYGQILGFDYVFDDIYLFVMQQDLTTGPLTWHTISKNVVSGVSYFRPLVMLTWFSEFHLFGRQPMISHGVNIIIFCCNILLVRSVTLAVLNKTEFIGKASMRAWLAAVIYAVHPALIEATAWVSGRFDLLCTLFILLAVRFFLATESRAWVQFMGVLICSLLAMFSKELGVVLIGTLLCVAMAARSGHETALRSRLWHDLANAVSFYRWGFYGVICSLPIYFIIRILSMDVAYNSNITLSYLYFSCIEQKLPVEAMRLYTGLTILPSITGISYFRNHVEHSAWVLVSSLGTLVMVATVIWMAAKGKKWAWLILAGFTGLALVIHIIPIMLGGNIVQDRFLAMPLAFFAMSAVSVDWGSVFNLKKSCVRVRNRKILLGLTFAGWLFVCTLTTLSALPSWKNSLLWWGVNYKFAPNTGDNRAAYINALFVVRQYDQIINILEPDAQQGKAMSMLELFFFARALNLKGDPRGVELLGSIISRLENTPITPTSSSTASAEQAFVSLQVGGVYTDYSIMKASQGDIESALRYANKGMNYLEKNFRLRAVLAKITFEYLDGHFDAGWNAVKTYVDVNHMDDTINGIKNVAANYCDKLDDGTFKGTDVNKAACERLRKSDFFRVPSFLGPIP